MSDTGFGPHEFGINMIGHSSGFDNAPPPTRSSANDHTNTKSIELAEGFNGITQNRASQGRSYEATPTEAQYPFCTAGTVYAITEYGANGAYRKTGITVNNEGHVVGSSYERFHPVTGELVQENNKGNVQDAFGYEQARKYNTEFYETQLTDFLREFQAATGEKIVVTGFNSTIKNPVSNLPYYVEEKVDFHFDEPPGYEPPVAEQTTPAPRQQTSQFILN